MLTNVPVGFTRQRLTWVAITFAANWISYASPYGPCSYAVDEVGMVYLRGLAQWVQGISPEGQTMINANGLPHPLYPVGLPNAGGMYLPFTVPCSVALPAPYGPYVQPDGSLVCRGVPAAAGGNWANSWYGLNGIVYQSA